MTGPPDYTSPLELSAVIRLRSLPVIPGISKFPPTPLRVLVRDPHIPYTFHIVPYTTQLYCAVSYTWPGKDTDRLYNSRTPCTIVRPDKTTYSSAHLSHFGADALSRSPYPDHALWIDGDCIDQSKTSLEKPAQMAAMDSIYQLAVSVLALLEDVELDQAIEKWLHSSQKDRIGVQRKSDRLVNVSARIMKARWFTRAWCSQELVLSRYTHFFFHNSDCPERPHFADPGTIIEWNSIHRARDQSVLKLSPPRGFVNEGRRPREQSVAWAAGVIAKMSCRDPWDKIRLVLNLLGVPREERAIWMPSAKDKEGYALEVVEENVVKVFNWIAIERNDFSLLLTGHAGGVKYGGMLWAGAQQNGDFVSEQWGAENYEVGKQQLPLSYNIERNTIRLSGVARKIDKYDAWEIWRDGHDRDQLWVKINGRDKLVPSDWLNDSELLTQKSLHILVDILYAIAACHPEAVAIYPHLQMCDEDWVYPEQFQGDLKDDIRRRFFRLSFMKHFEVARNFAGMRGADEIIRFKVIQTDPGTAIPPLLVQGSVEDLRGKVIFQPWVTRPYLFNCRITTVNSMVLEDCHGQWRCVGGLRGWGLLLDPEVRDEPVRDGSVKMTLDIY